MAKKVRATKETATGRNTAFYDPVRHRSMTRSDFVRAIQKGSYPDYHVREIDGIKTPVSNPDGSTGNNLD